MWSPTHVQVIVQRAKSLRIKGKNGANDTYVTIQLGKEKFQTSVQEKTNSPEWHEECELSIPDGNTSCITLTVFHRNFMGLDKFLGRVDVPLQELDIYERPRNKVYSLRGKSSNGSDTKIRGEIEVRFAFVVKSVTGSLMDLSKKPQKSNSLPLKMVHSVGGSLMNLGGKDKKLSLGNLKGSLGGKLKRKKKAPKNGSFLEEGEIHDDISIGDVGDISDFDAVSIASSSQTSDVPTQLASSNSELHRDFENSGAKYLERPPSPISLSSSPKSDLNNVPSDVFIDTIFESPEQFKVSSESLEIEEKPKQSFQVNKTTTINPPKLSNVEKEVANKNNDNLKSARRQINSLAKPITNLVKNPFHHNHHQNNNERSNINITNDRVNKYSSSVTNRQDINKLASNEVLNLYDAMTKQELIELLCKQRALLENQQCHINSLEDYIDNLLVRVMDNTPRILQNPFKSTI